MLYFRKGSGLNVALLVVTAAVALQLNPKAQTLAATQADCDASKPNNGCSFFGRCQSSPGTCKCNDGFTGDGETCTSSCLDNADQLCQQDSSAACVDLPSSNFTYGCACKSGYYFNTVAKVCQDVDECTGRPCAPYASCSNVVGDYECECCYSNMGFANISGFGYVGDGKTRCYPDSILSFGHSDNSSFTTETNSYRHVRVPGGFPFYGKLYWDIYVHTNGLITFESPDAPYFGGQDDAPSFSTTKFIAPFWTDLEVSPLPGSGLYVDVHSFFTNGVPASRSEIDKRFPSFYSWIDELQLGDFFPRQILTSTWKSMVASPSADFDGVRNRARITFQTTIASNGSHSFGYTSYAEAPADTDWNVPLDGVYIGQSTAGNADRQKANKISDLFKNPANLDTVCQTMTFLTQRGRFYSLYGPDFVENDNAACLDEATKQWRTYGNFGLDDSEVSDDIGEGNAKPPGLYCPCLEQQAFSDNRFVLANIEELSDARHSCHMSRFYKDVNTTARLYRARAYCCYDNKGSLITDGVNAGGVVPDGLENDMKKLKNTCCADASLCDVFHAIYKTVGCLRYDRPRVSYIRGAVHFSSFTNENYTFNGKGEYNYVTMINPIITSQVRLVDTTYSTGNTTSFVKGLAVECSVPADSADSNPAIRVIRKAEILVDSTGPKAALKLLIDGEETKIPVMPFEFSTMFYVGCDETFCEVACKYSNNIFSFQAGLVNDYLRLNTTIPASTEVPTLKIEGLAGTLEGELSYINEDGSDLIYVDDLNDEAAVFVFGESTRTNVDNSIFTYTDGVDSWDTYNNAEEYKPAYWSEIKPTITIDQFLQFYHCENDHACQYDQAVTGNKAISTATHQALQTITTDRNAFASRTPQWNKPPAQFIINAHQSSGISLGSYVTYDEGGPPPAEIPDGGARSRQRRALMQADSFEVITDLNPMYYDFDPISGNFTIKPNVDKYILRYGHYPISFYAVKKGAGSFVARSRYSPDIFVCACEKEDQCDTSYASRTYFERESNFDQYYLLPCKCPIESDYRFCDGHQDEPCFDKPCSKDGTCNKDASGPWGYTCSCNEGYSGNGFICNLDQCPSPSGCSQGCKVDPLTAQPICTCEDGYILDKDKKTCKDINECDIPGSCSSENQICRNTNGSYYCECESGYKAVLGRLCVKASHLFSGSIEFESFWDVNTKTWVTWKDDFKDNSSPKHVKAARQLDITIGLMIQLVEPIQTDLYVFVYELRKGKNDGIHVLFKFYPEEDIALLTLENGLKEYFTRRPDGSVFKAVDPSTISLSALVSLNKCPPKNSTIPACSSPFASCKMSDQTGKVCRCNAGFIEAEPSDENGQNTCERYCLADECDAASTHSCRDISTYGAQCLCKKGYKYNENFRSCEMIRYCQNNPCGPNSECEDVDGSFKCTCYDGFEPSNKPPPTSFCVQQVLYGKNVPEDQQKWPDGVEVNPEKDYKKVLIPVGFPFGTTKQWRLFVGYNGVIGLNQPPTATESASFFPSSYGHFIAPLWADFETDPDALSILVYDDTMSEFTTFWQGVFNHLQQDIQHAQEGGYPFYSALNYPNIDEPSDFEPKSIVIATWKNARLKPYDKREHATFEVVIASDGFATVVLANYDSTDSMVSSWTSSANGSTAYPHRGFVGFQVGSNRVCLDQNGFSPSANCRNFHFDQLVAPLSETIPAGRHIFVVANDYQVTTFWDRQCYYSMKFWLVDKVEISREMYELYSAVGRSQTPPGPCPWTETQAKQDIRFQQMGGVASCYQRRFTTPFPYGQSGGEIKVANIRPFCCYRREAILFQSQGMSHLIAEEFSDIQNGILNACCAKSAHCPIASLFVPPTYIRGYQPPVTVGVYGEPHLVTISGADVTHKGRGDFVLIEHPILKVHGRFSAFGDVEGSALEAVAWKADDYPKVVVTVNSVTGYVTFHLDGEVVDLKQYTDATAQFNVTSGHIFAEFDVDRLDHVSVTYPDGLSVEISNLEGLAAMLSYLQVRIRLPQREYLSDSPLRGLLGIFEQPDGQAYEPMIYGDEKIIGDEHYFKNFGKNWAVASANVGQLFDGDAKTDSYEPPFYESLLEAPPTATPGFDGCNTSMACAYDLRITGDETLAGHTLDESLALHKIRMEASEKPPTFKLGLNPSTWIINVNLPFYDYLPQLQDLTPDVTFSMDTNFPRRLYVIDPATGRFRINMTSEARTMLVYQGPYFFYIVARRGATGATSFKPLVVRICNCANGGTCDYSDDADDVGMTPTENADRYSVAPCKCQSSQTGRFCEKTYSACADNAPCYPGTNCLPQPNSGSNPSFDCLACPAGLTGDGFQCIVKDLCEDVLCLTPKRCNVVEGVARCLCPPNSELSPIDGSCIFEDRCSELCIEQGMNCNTDGYGNFWCDCQSGYAPIYQDSLTSPKIVSCKPIAYTYHGQVSFEWYYTPMGDLVRFGPIYAKPSSDVGKTFARDITADLKNAFNLLKYDSVVSVAIVKVSSFGSNFGFIVDYLAYSDDERLNAEQMQAGIIAYFEQTHKVGTLVQIVEPKSKSFFVDICSSKTLNPCQEILDIASCRQPGMLGFPAVCNCNVSLLYSPYPVVSEDGLICVDNCDSRCKSLDPNAECDRPNGRDQPHECVCTKGYAANHVTGKCEQKPPVCLPDSCGANSDCVEVSDTKFDCVCWKGFTPKENQTGCISYCEAVNYCKDDTNSISCSNLDTEHRCNCKGGYAWNKTESKCSDVDECAVGAPGCSVNADCVNTQGSFSCRCKAEYAPGMTPDDGSVCFGDTLYPYNFSANKTLVRDNDGVWDTTFLGGFYYNGSVFFKIHVGFDGFIALDQLPPYKYFGRELSTHLIAPLFVDLDFNATTASAGLYVDVFDKAWMTPDAKWKEVFGKAIANLRLQYPDRYVDPNLVPDMMIIATWKEVSPAPFSAYNQYATTAQVVLAMTSGYSFAILNHLEPRSSSRWPTLDKAPSLQPLIGYTSGTRDITFNTINGNPNSFQNVFNDNGPQIRGRHVTIVGENSLIDGRKCLTEYQKFSSDAEAIIAEIGASEQVAQHSSCPGFLKQMKLDPRWQQEIELTDKTITCYGGSFWTRVNISSGVIYNVRSFCCYDDISGAWLDNGAPARHAGSFVQIEELRSVQEALFFPCCRDSPFCEVFNMKHAAPALSPDNYRAPAVGYVIGDPHLSPPRHTEDFDGREFTFNGFGEYTLVKSKPIPDQRYNGGHIQIRFGITSSTEKATFVTGIAFQIGQSDTIEVITHNGELLVFVNKTKIDKETLLQHELAAESSYDLWADETDNFIGFASHSGLSLAIYEIDNSYFEVRVSLPQYLENHFADRMCGLLVSFDEEPYRDCEGNPASGQIYEIEEDTYKFAEKFKLTQEKDSLFSYVEGPSFEQANQVPSGWKPTYRADLKFPPDVDDVCRSQRSCEYDYAITINKTLAARTRVSATEFQEQQDYSTVKRISIVNTNGTLIIRPDASSTVFEVDVDTSLDATLADSLFFSVDTSILPSLYAFNSTNGHFTMQITDVLLRELRRRQAPYFRFIAFNGPASDVWTPAVFTCACDQVSQCDFTYPSLFYLERLSNARHNYFLPCHCPPTRRGVFCEVPFDPCSENPCSAGVQCTVDEKSATGFTCGACPPGYVSVNGACKPSVCPGSYCTNGNCLVSDTDGSFYCQCWNGFELSSTNNQTCLDINECQRGTHDCYGLGKGMDCVNLQGSFVCSCKPGYSPDNTTNIKACIPEANQINGKIKAQSVVVGTSTVTWSPALGVFGSPLFLSTSAQIESDILNWYRNSLGQDVTSVFVKQLSEGSIVADYAANFKNAPNEAAIKAEQQKYFTANAAIGNMQGVDPASVTISSNLCDGDTFCDKSSTQCMWTSGMTSPRCDCLDGFVVNPSTAASCTDNCPTVCNERHGPNSRCVRNSPTNFTCECLPNFSTTPGSLICVDKCASGPCKNGGTCGLSATSATGYVCRCPATHVGATCSLKCECENSGSCYEQAGAAKCQCAPGFSGELCKTVDPVITNCTVNPCKHEGVCGVTASGFVCVCPSNKFYGKLCEKDCNCENNGICNAVTDACMCTPEFTGNNCEIRIISEESDYTALIAVSSVLGSLVFILVCVVAYMLLRPGSKNKKAPSRSSSSSASSNHVDAVQSAPANPAVYGVPYAQSPVNQIEMQLFANPTLSEPVHVGGLPRAPLSSIYDTIRSSNCSTIHEDPEKHQCEF